MLSISFNSGTLIKLDNLIMSKTTYIMATDPCPDSIPKSWRRHSRKKQRLHSYLGPNDSWVLTKFNYIEVLLYLLALVIGEKKCSSSRLRPNVLFRQKKRTCLPLTQLLHDLRLSYNFWISIFTQPKVVAEPMTLMISLPHSKPVILRWAREESAAIIHPPFKHFSTVFMTPK